MDASIEMKAVALEKIIETQKQLIQMKKDLGLSVPEDADRIFITSTADFMAYAEQLKESVFTEKRDFISIDGTYTYAFFYHSNMELHTYPSDAEMKEYFSKDAVEDHE